MPKQRVFGASRHAFCAALFCEGNQCGRTALPGNDVVAFNSRLREVPHHIMKAGSGMGTLLYGQTIEVAFDDRVLAHLQLVIGLKLRRDESFFFCWHDEQGVGYGRSAIWLDPAIPLVFRYSSGLMPRINREWLEALTLSSNSSQGLQLVEEVGAPHKASGE